MELEVYQQVSFVSNPVLYDQKLYESRGIANVDLNLAFQSLGLASVELLAASSTLALECRVRVSRNVGMM